MNDNSVVKKKRHQGKRPRQQQQQQQASSDFLCVFCSAPAEESSERRGSSSVVVLHRKKRATTTRAPFFGTASRGFFVQLCVMFAASVLQWNNKMLTTAAWTSTTYSPVARSAALPRRILAAATKKKKTIAGAAAARWSMMATDSRELRFFHGLTSSSSQSNNKSTSTLLSDLSSMAYSHVFRGAATTTTTTTTTAEQIVFGRVLATTTVAAGVEGEAVTDTITTTVAKTAATTTPYYYFTSRKMTDNANKDDNGGKKLEQQKSTGNNNNNNNKIKLQQQQQQRRRPPAILPRTAAQLPAPSRRPQVGYGPSIQLTDEERDLFQLLRRVRIETGLHTTLRVAGGWVRDKLLATPEFQAYHKVFDVGGSGGGGSLASSAPASKTTRLTSKFRSPSSGSRSSLGRQGTKVLIGNTANACQPVDIDIALDDMLGREFADHLNEYLTAHGKDEVAVGMVLKNPEKSKHLETATMKVGSFWIDFVNLRAEEYTQDSRIPDLMRIGTADEDAFRRDLTINALFYNINTGQVEDWTGRGFQDLRKGVVATPLPPLTTLLDDPLRVLRSIRFAARLRFSMDEELIEAAKTGSVGNALSQKVSRERVGGELDLMLRSPDPVGAVRLLINLKLVDCVFPVAPYFREIITQQISLKEGAAEISDDKMNQAVSHLASNAFSRGLDLLSTAHDHLADCRWSPPVWCINNNKSVYGVNELRLVDDEEARRLLWYAAFLKPLYDDFKIQQANARRVSKRKPGSKKTNRSIVAKMLVDELKRPIRDAEAIEKIMKAADDFSRLLNNGCSVSATIILLSDVKVTYTTATNNGEEACDLETNSCVDGRLLCSMGGRMVDCRSEDDPVWEHAMEFRLLCSEVLRRIGPLWRAALFLAISEELVKSEKHHGIDYAIEGDVVDESQEGLRQGVMERFDAFAAALQQMGLIGIWNEKPLADGDAIKKILPRIPKGPAFREVMDEQTKWMTTHPGAGLEALKEHLRNVFPNYAENTEKAKRK